VSAPLVVESSFQRAVALAHLVVLGAVAVVLADALLVPAEYRPPAFAAACLLALAGAWRITRIRAVVDDEGITATNFWSTTRLVWEEARLVSTAMVVPYLSSAVAFHGWEHRAVLHASIYAPGDDDARAALRAELRRRAEQHGVRADL
jgi:hypothetical protein